MREGDKVGRYRLVRRLGRGSFGLAFLAHDELIDAELCLKILHAHLVADPAVVARFQRELLIARRVTHPNVCRAFDFGLTDDGVAFMTMEFVEGENLSRHFTRRAPLPLPVCIDLFAELCGGVAAAHRLDVVHRDLKPSNIIVRPSGAPVICDFGLARAADLEKITNTGMVMGTTAYMPPEAWTDGIVAPTVDVWALGIMLYRGLTGERPFSSKLSGQELLTAMRERPPPLCSSLVDGLNPAVDVVVDRALAIDPRERYPDAAVLREALLELSEWDGSEVETADHGPRGGAVFDAATAIARSSEVSLSTQNDPLSAVSTGVSFDASLTSSSMGVSDDSSVDGAVGESVERSVDTVVGVSRPGSLATLPSNWGEAETRLQEAPPSSVQRSSSSDTPLGAPREELEPSVDEASLDPTRAAPPGPPSAEVVPFDPSASTAVRPLGPARRTLAAVFGAFLVIVVPLATWAVLARDSVPASTELTAASSTAGGQAPAAVASTVEPPGADPREAEPPAVAPHKIEAPNIEAPKIDVNQPKSAADRGATMARVDVAPSKSPPKKVRSAARSSSPMRGLSARRRQLEAKMRARSITTDDDAKLAQALAGVRKAERTGRSATMASQLRAAEQRLEQVRVDRAFVERKLGRFNALFNKLDEKGQQRLDADANQITRALAAQNYDKANRLLTASLRRHR